MADNPVLNYYRTIPDVMQALAGVHEMMDQYGLERSLHHLVLLRASQMNGCGFCVEMHTREARADGETNERLDQVVVWDQVKLFNERERAALAWTEALTHLQHTERLPGLRDDLAEHFSAPEISVLTATVGMINLWNRVQVARH